MAKSSKSTPPKNIDEYVASFPKNMQAILQKVRTTIKRAAPGAEEAISYNIPTFRLNGTYLIYFAAWKNHISLYPFSSAMEASLHEASAYDTSGKGTIRFPADKALPLGLITEIVKFRMKESSEMQKLKKQ